MGLFGFGKSKIDKRKKDWIIESADWSNKGNELAKLGKDQEAIECYDKAISLDSTNWRAWSNKGNELAKLGKDEESIVCCSQAIRLNPEDLSAE